MKKPKRSNPKQSASKKRALSKPRKNGERITKRVSKSATSPKKKRTQSAPKSLPKISPVPFTKKHGKEIYYIDLKPGEKTNEEIQKVISRIDMTKINKGKLPDKLLKVTFFSKKNDKEKQALTNIYRVDNLKETPKVVSEIWQNITTRPNRNTKHYMKRINKLRGYVRKIIIDFETAGMQVKDKARSGSRLHDKRKKKWAKK